jgi:outer membrane immunogenic protein
MKRGVLFAFCVTAALAAPAVAQDGFNWTGFFAGINTGYTSGNGDGFIGGGQVGYDYLLPSGWLIGFETDAQATTINPTIHASGTFGPAGSFTLNYNSSLDFIGTARLRLGTVLPQNVLIYATGGLAYGSVTATSDFRMQQGSVPTTSSLHRSAMDVGWAAGAGAEYPITEHLRLRGEYLYTDLGSYSVQQPLTGATSGTASMSGNTSAHIGRIALSYALN